ALYFCDTLSVLRLCRTPMCFRCVGGGVSLLFAVRNNRKIFPKDLESRMSFEAAVNRKAIDLGKLSVEMTTAAGSGHPSTALSLGHLVTVLMYHQMRWDPKDPWNRASDRLVLS